MVGLETVEAPDECQLYITGHIVHFHAVILSGAVDGHRGRPSVEDVFGLQVNLAATFLAELPFYSRIDLPHARQAGYSLYRRRDVCEVYRQ